MAIRNELEIEGDWPPGVTVVSVMNSFDEHVCEIRLDDKTIAHAYSIRQLRVVIDLIRSALES